MEQFELTLVGRTRSLPFSELPAERSRHTGRPLRCVQLVFTVEGEETNGAVLNELGEANTAEGALGGEDGQRWLVTQHSWRHEVGNERYEHQVELREAEDLKPTGLEFAGLDLVPDRYLEELADDRIMITTIVSPDENADRALEALVQAHMDKDRPVYFPLRRVGISDDPISVRLGKCLRERPSTGRRHRLIFVQEGAESPPGTFVLINQPEIYRTEEMAAANRRAIAVLLEELRQAGMLNDGAISRIREALRTDDLQAKQMRPFSEVARDLDDYMS
jgi:hypothetical protein